MYKHIINHSDLSKLGDMIMLDLFGFIQNKMWKDVGGGGWLVMMPCKIVPVIYTESQKINQLNEVAVYLYQVAHITCKSFVQVLKINAANLDDGTACLTFDSLCLPSFFFFPTGVCTISFFTMNLNMDPFIQGSVLFKWRQIHFRTHLEHVYNTSRSYENVFVRKKSISGFFFLFVLNAQLQGEFYLS